MFQFLKYFSIFYSKTDYVSESDFYMNNVGWFRKCNSELILISKNLQKKNSASENTSPEYSLGQDWISKVHIVLKVV